MLITKVSVLTGIVRNKNLDVTPEQIKEWQGGALIQDSMPNLSLEEREFIITGTTDEEWSLLEDE